MTLVIAFILSALCGALCHLFFCRWHENNAPVRPEEQRYD